MSWWGKLLGGTFGFLVGGPLGALLGAALGHNFDRNLSREDSLRGSLRVDQERAQTAFFTATFAVMGHVCKADGRVSSEEIALARSVMAQMELDERQRETAMRLFTQGKTPDFPLQEVLRQFRQETGGRRSLARVFMQIQLAAALADGELGPVERGLLGRVAEGIGLAELEFAQLEAAVRAATEARRPAPAEPARPTLAQAYALLGVEPTADEADIKRAYRRLLSQHHPDKLVSRGLPEEMLKLATRRTREVREAFQAIRAARGF